MCRYAMCGPYKEKWACFGCRKCFKQTNQIKVRHGMPMAENGSRLVVCPQCRTLMHNMGLDFKAPRQNDKEQWRKVELLFAHGYNYSSCGCNGPGPRPARLNDVPAFLKERQQVAAYWERCNRIQMRAAQLAAKRKNKRKLREKKRVEKLEQRVHFSCAS